MSKAVKCDKCGKLVEFKATSLSGQAIRSILRSGWHPDEIELCIDCADKLYKKLQEWWNDVSQ